MKTKIIPFPAEHFHRKKQRALSKSMVAKLSAALKLEREDLFFGPQDIKGLTPLINRGLIIRVEITLNGKKETIWHVSYEAVDMLKALGCDIEL